jgi:hypothetical protein
MSGHDQYHKANRLESLADAQLKEWKEAIDETQAQ